MCLATKANLVLGLLQCHIDSIFRVMWTAYLHWILILLIIPLCCVLALLCCNEPDPHRRDRLAKTLESFLPCSLNSRVTVSAQDGRSFGQCEAGTYDKVGRVIFMEAFGWIFVRHNEVTRFFFTAMVRNEWAQQAFEEKRISPAENKKTVYSKPCWSRKS